GGKAVADPHSVDDAESGRQIVDTALSEFGRLDVLINNAGILRDSSFHNMQVEDFEAVLKVHLAGSFYVTHPAYRHMREQGYGRIVLTTSAAGLYGNFGQVNYSAAKMGLVGMAKTLAQEGAKRNIRTNLIAPAAASRMTQDLMPVSMKDLLTPESVAPVTAYLAHESCALNGETLTGFGGHVARAFVGETAGVNRTDLTIESVAAALDEIVDTTRFSIPGSPMDTLVSLTQSSR
ncbi:MAG: short-chain dehydrogenase/reductase, partial [Streptosporangiaceae bacterium]|nr:short-chain dehydrogenase/reductase [Streptosporangiaceae bacterium]